MSNDFVKYYDMFTVCKLFVLILKAHYFSFKCSIDHLKIIAKKKPKIANTNQWNWYGFLSLGLLKYVLSTDAINQWSHIDVTRVSVTYHTELYKKRTEKNRGCNYQTILGSITKINRIIIGFSQSPFLEKLSF